MEILKKDEKKTVLLSADNAQHEIQLIFHLQHLYFLKKRLLWSKLISVLDVHFFLSLSLTVRQHLSLKARLGCYLDEKLWNYLMSHQFRFDLETHTASSNKIYVFSFNLI